MVEKRPNRPSLPTLPDFERQFKEKYGRHMTPDEQRFFKLTENLLENPPEEDGEMAS
jgi:hypothetical protein